MIRSKAAGEANEKTTAAPNFCRADSSESQCSSVRKRASAGGHVGSARSARTLVRSCEGNWLRPSLRACPTPMQYPAACLTKTGAWSHRTRTDDVWTRYGMRRAALPVWSWDSIWLSMTARRIYLHLYLVIDIWSKRIVGWRIARSPQISSGHYLFRFLALPTTGGGTFRAWYSAYRAFARSISGCCRRLVPPPNNRMISVRPPWRRCFG